MAKIFYFLGHEQFQPEVLVQHAILAEKSGFDGVATSEHFNPWVADLGSAGFAFSTLGAIAVKTNHIQLMTEVVNPLFRYHPAVIAQASATVDRLSNGRFLLGVGTGEAINEVPLGYHFPEYQERAERIKEAITIIKQLLHSEKVYYQGKYYQTEAKLYSPPLHPVPIFLAAGGPKSATLAGELADGVIISVKDLTEALENIIKPATEKAQELHKNFAVVTARWTVFAQNDQEAWEALGAWRGLRAPSRNKATDPEQLQKEADTLPREEILSRYTIVSSPQEYIAAYLPLIQKLNTNIVIIHTTGKNQEEIIKLLGSEVLPFLK